MAGLENAGIMGTSALTPYYYPDTLWFVQNYYVNQFPILSRANRLPVNSPTFAVRHWKYRPRKIPFAGSVTNGTNLNNTDTFTVLVLTNQTNRQLNYGDATTLMAGDVISIDSERVEVIATPAMDPGAMPTLATYGYGGSVPAAGTVVIRRGAEGTTVATHTAGTVGVLQGNSRTGAEVNQTGIAANPIQQTQIVQNFEFPVQVGGQVEASSNADGLQRGSQFDIVKMQQLDNMMRDMEHSSIYGLGEALAVNNNLRPKQIGIANQVVTNRVVSPTNASAYLPQNFINDVLTPLWGVGSAPDFLMCSADFLGALDQWSYHTQLVDVGETTLGRRIEVYQSNLAPGVAIIPNITMNSGELYCGMSELLFWRFQEGENFQPRGKRGDAYEGDWFARGAIEVRDEEKHVYLSGITGYGTP